MFQKLDSASILAYLLRPLVELSSDLVSCNIEVLE